MTCSWENLITKSVEGWIVPMELKERSSGELKEHFCLKRYKLVEKLMVE